MSQREWSLQPWAPANSWQGIPKKDRNEKRAEPLAVPLTLGKHRGHFMAMFEIFFGKFSIEKVCVDCFFKREGFVLDFLSSLRC